MADIAQILLLPPPAPPLQRLPAREQELAVNAEAQGGDTGRAKRFRFRVHEGGDSSETSTDLTTRRTATRLGTRNGGSAEDGAAQASAGRIRYASADSRPGASSAFLAQAFAQEELGEGLHNPPYAAASAAYSRTGAALSPRTGAGLDIRA